ncbi:apolipoprotein L1-like [Pecten maximus]|uniref:apolipoprotein L1-like n=1 Tax=Pecten maximus TaxID=6579 RepID=UPI001458D0E1|nr:apolipoprotein L1-like [Pecten maximus]
MSSIKTWLGKRQNTIQLLRKLAVELDNMQEKVNISKLAGTSGAIVGGLGTLACLAAAPFTGGLSTLGIAAFGSVGLAGGAVNLGTLIGKHFHEKDLTEQVQKALNDDREESEKLNKELEISSEESEKLNDPNLNVSNTGKTAVKLASDAKELRSASRVAAKGVSKMAVFVTVAFLPLDILDLVQTSIKVHEGSINESAAEVRRIARKLEQEMEEMKGSFEKS